MKLLLAIDDSRYSEAAVDLLLSRFRRDLECVCVLHVVEPFWVVPTSHLAESMEAAQRELRRDGEELAARTTERLRQAGFTVYPTVEEGQPTAQIIDFARREKNDLILLGSHGWKGLERFAIGSTSEAVARHAPCSVLIAHPPAARP